PDVLFELAGKLHIRTMARPACDNVRLNRIAHQCKVAHDVEELMPCRFVGKAEFEVVEVSLALDFNLIFLENLLESLHFLAINLLVNDHNSVVDVAAFDEIIVEQHFQFMQEAKSAAGSNLRLEFV